MRCYQHVGLKPEAEEFLRNNVKRKPSIVCPDCGKVIAETMDMEVYNREDLFFGDGPNLHKYVLKDGRIAKEILQCSPWSSGPVGFLCLEIDGKMLFKWTEKEMKYYL